MKKTPLTEVHREAGAKMTEFAGYEMPLYYTSVMEEHLAVRTGAGLFDVSHMGEFIIKGREALRLVQSVTTNDVNTLSPGQAQYSCLPNYEGGIIDDLLVYRLFEDRCASGEQAFMLVVNASNVENDLKWIEKHNDYKAAVEDISEKTGLLALQGPKAEDILQKVTDTPLSQIKYYTYQKGAVAGQEDILISATGYTGSGGFELYCRNEQLPHIWKALFEADEQNILVPAGLGARDTLRLEMGYCLYGNDIDVSTSPVEASLGWITKPDSAKFPSSELFAEQKAKGVDKKLVGFVCDSRRIPRKDYPILSDGGEEIGRVTSGCYSPVLEKPIGMGYIKTGHTKVGTPVKIKIHDKEIDAEVLKMPFVKIPQ